MSNLPIQLGAVALAGLGYLSSENQKSKEEFSGITSHSIPPNPLTPQISSHHYHSTLYLTLLSIDESTHRR
jgi:hypothetical protein